MLKAASALKDNMIDPATAFSQDPSEAPFNRYFKTKLNYFEWLEEPNNDHRLERFGIAMDGFRAIVPEHLTFRGVSSIYTVNRSLALSLYQGFDWNSLSDAPLVDVAGGLGSTAAALSKAFPNLNIIVQERAAIIPGGKKVRILRLCVHMDLMRLTVLGLHSSPWHFVWKSHI